MHMMALPPPSWPQGPSLLYTNTSAHGAVVYSSDDPCGHHAPLRSSCALAVIMRPCGHHAPLRSSCALAAIMEVIIRPCGHHAPLRSSCALAAIMAVIMRPCGHDAPLRPSWWSSSVLAVIMLASDRYVVDGLSHWARCVYGLLRLLLPVWFRWHAWSGTAGEEDADEKDGPANGHDQPEDIFDAQAGSGAGECIDHIASENEYIGPQEAACALATHQLPAGIDGYTNNGKYAKRIEYNDGN